MIEALNLDVQGRVSFPVSFDDSRSKTVDHDIGLFSRKGLETETQEGSTHAYKLMITEPSLFSWFTMRKSSVRHLGCLHRLNPR